MVVKNIMMYRPISTIKYTCEKIGYQNFHILILFGCGSFDILREGFEEIPIKWTSHFSRLLW